MSETLPDRFAIADVRRRLVVLAASYRRLTGRELVAGGGDPATALWNAPQVIVAHGAEADPLFFFGNRVALELFECTAEQFAAMPSQLSAEPLARDERQALLEQVRCRGFIENYAGARVSSRGRRFRIEQAVVWNLIDAAGEVHGQAAAFDRWTEL